MSFEPIAVRYRLLGPVAAFRDGEPIALGGRGQLTLLAALLLRPGAVVPDQQLIDLLWPDSPPVSARGQLQVRVSELRKMLGREAIVRRSPGYLIEAGAVDLAEFGEAVELAGREIAAGEARAGADRLREALSWWQGEPLGGANDELRGRFVPALDEQRVAAMEQLFEAELSLERAEVIGELRAACEAYPFRESLRAQLMRALRQAGRPAEALAGYEEFRRRLDEEQGIEPGSGLRELYLRMRGGDEPARPVRPAELPYGTNGFAGRAAELAELDEALEGQRATGVQVWLLHGVAGVGKSALAVHWARRVRARFPDGQLYVNMRGFDADRAPVTPALALEQLLGSLGEPQRASSGPDAKAGRYRSLLSDKNVLLLLDNVSDAAQVLEVLPPSGTVLVTSRHRLNELVVRTGARCVQLDVLPDEDAAALLRGALGEAQVAAEADAAAALASLCGHLPLALQIAAANVRSAPQPRITDLVAELSSGDRLHALTLDGAEDSTVIRAFDASYHALSPELREAFRLLAVIPGADFGPAVAAAVTGLPVDVISRRLNMLTAAHLLEQHAPRRYRFHDLVREYALGKSRAEDSAEQTEPWRRLVEFYVATTDSAVAPLASSLRLPRESEVVTSYGNVFADAKSISAWVETEQVNIFAALRQAVASGPFPLAWYFVDNVRIMGHGYGTWTAWMEIAGDIVAAARRRGEVRLAALVQYSVANALVIHGEMDRAIEALTRAVRAHRADGWREAEAATLAALGIAVRRVGRLTEATGYLRQAGEIHHARGFQAGELTVLGNLGYVYWQAGQLLEARESLDRALELGRRMNLPSSEGILLVSVGLVLLAQGKPADAEAAFLRARDVHSELGSPFGQAFALAGASLARGDQGDHERARELARTAMNLARSGEHREAEVRALNALGRAESALGLVESARERQREALAVAHRVEAPWDVAETLTGMCWVELDAGDAGAAVRHGLAALELTRKHEFRTLEARALLGLARAYRELGDDEAAVIHLREARELCESRGFAVYYGEVAALSVHYGQQDGLA